MSFKLSILILFPKGFVKMQGNYNELVQSNKDFIRMMNNLNHEAQKKEEETRRISEMSIRKISIMRRASGLSTASSTIVRSLSLVTFHQKTLKS